MLSKKLNKRTLSKIIRLGKNNRSIKPFIWNLLSITIDSTKIQDITIDGSQAQEVTIDGNTVWTAGPNVNEITTDVTLNGQAIDLTIYEDTTGDGNADNTETITVGDGTNTYSLSNLDGSSGNDYWIQWQLTNSDITKTAIANSAQLKNVGTWETSTEWDNNQTQTGIVHESVSNTDHKDATTIKKGYEIKNPYLLSDLIGYWPLHEDSGSTAYDFSGNNNNGSVNGAGPDGSGTVNAPLGVSSYLYISSDSVSTTYPSNGSDNFTISFWFKMDSSSNMDDQFFEVQTGPDASYMKIYVTDADGDGDPEVMLDWRTDDEQNVEVTTTKTIQKGKWYHCVYTRNPNDGTGDKGFDLYLNGEKNKQITRDQEPAQTDLGFGGYTFYIGNSIDGALSEVRLYNRALSSSEVQDLYDVVNTNGNLTTEIKSS